MQHLISTVTARARRARQNEAAQHHLHTTLYEREREHLAFNQHAIASIADAAGNITYVNDRFCKISGYERPELRGQSHRIRISDTGKGIPEPRLDELFQPFNRLDAEISQIEGTGIGLTITRKIIEMMGGTVGVQSKVGVGSTFWIELPLAS